MNHLRLKKIREERKKTQEEVAEFIGVNVRTYQNYESGKSDIKSKELQSLASLYNVSVGFFLENENENHIKTGDITNKDGTVFSGKQKNIELSGNMSIYEIAIESLRNENKLLREKLKRFEED